MHGMICCATWPEGALGGSTALAAASCQPLRCGSCYSGEMALHAGSDGRVAVSDVDAAMVGKRPSPLAHQSAGQPPRWLKGQGCPLRSGICRASSCTHCGLISRPSRTTVTAKGGPPGQGRRAEGFAVTVLLKGSAVPELLIMKRPPVWYSFTCQAVASNV